MNDDLMRQMLVEQRVTNERKSLFVAYLLWFFLGVIGTHRIYLHATGTGLMQAAFFVGGMALLLVAQQPLAFALVGFAAIWVLADVALIPSMRDAHSRKLRAEMLATMSRQTDHGSKERNARLDALAAERRSTQRQEPHF